MNTHACSRILRTASYSRAAKERCYRQGFIPIAPGYCAYPTSCEDPSATIWSAKHHEFLAIAESVCSNHGHRVIITGPAAAVALGTYTNCLPTHIDYYCESGHRIRTPRGKNHEFQPRLRALPSRGIDAVEVEGILVPQPAQAIVDAARMSDEISGFVAACGILHAQCTMEGTWNNRSQPEVVLQRAQRIQCDARELARTLTPQAGRRKASRVIEAMSAQCDSTGEARLLYTLLTAGLPAPSLQHRVDTPLGPKWLDAYYEQWNLGLEFHGKMKFEGVNGLQQMSAAVERDFCLGEMGITVLNIWWKDVLNGRKLVERILAHIPTSAHPPRPHGHLPDLPRLPRTPASHRQPGTLQP